MYKQFRQRWRLRFLLPVAEHDIVWNGNGQCLELHNRAPVAQSRKGEINLSGTKWLFSPLYAVGKQKQVILSPQMLRDLQKVVSRRVQTRDASYFLPERVMCNLLWEEVFSPWSQSLGFVSALAAGSSCAPAVTSLPICFTSLHTRQKEHQSGISSLDRCQGWWYRYCHLRCC